MSLPRTLIDDILTENNICMVKTTCVRGPTLARLAMVLVLEAGGKPSTWFPPERLVELTSHARSMGISSDEFLMKTLKFSKNLENVIFLKFYRETAVTFDSTLIEQIDK